MKAQTDRTARTFRSALVGWCRVCNVYTDSIEGECPFYCETSASSGRYVHQIRRRVLICSECAMCFFSKKGQESTQEAEEHGCYPF